MVPKLEWQSCWRLAKGEGRCSTTKGNKRVPPINSYDTQRKSNISISPLNTKDKPSRLSCIYWKCRKKKSANLAWICYGNEHYYQLKGEVGLSKAWQDLGFLLSQMSPPLQAGKGRITTQQRKTQEIAFFLLATSVDYFLVCRIIVHVRP